MGSDTNDISRAEWFIGVTSFFSCVASLTVLFTYWRFKQIRSQVYMQLVFFLSVCDFSSSLFLISTYQDGGPLCWTQGIILNYFQLAGVLWMDVIVWHLYRTVILGKVLRNHSRYHKFAWGVPFVYTILTLTTNNMGTSNGDKRGYCWVVDRWNYPLLLFFFQLNIDTIEVSLSYQLYLYLLRPGFSTQWTSVWEVTFFVILWLSCILLIVVLVKIALEVITLWHLWNWFNLWNSIIDKIQGVLDKPYIKKAYRSVAFIFWLDNTENLMYLFPSPFSDPRVTSHVYPNPNPNSNPNIINRKLVVYPLILTISYSLISYRFFADVCYPSSTNYSQQFSTLSDVVLAAMGIATCIHTWIHCLRPLNLFFNILI